MKAIENNQDNSFVENIRENLGVMHALLDSGSRLFGEEMRSFDAEEAQAAYELSKQDNENPTEFNRLWNITEAFNPKAAHNAMLRSAGDIEESNNLWNWNKNK